MKFKINKSSIRNHSAIFLTLLWRRPLSYRNQSIDLLITFAAKFCRGWRGVFWRYLNKKSYGILLLSWFAAFLRKKKKKKKTIIVLGQELPHFPILLLFPMFCKILRFISKSLFSCLNNNAMSFWYIQNWQHFA